MDTTPTRTAGAWLRMTARTLAVALTTTFVVLGAAAPSEASAPSPLAPDAPAGTAGTVTVHVAPGGAGDGSSSSSPAPDLATAQSTARSLGGGSKNVDVRIAAGTYRTPGTSWKLASPGNRIRFVPEDYESSSAGCPAKRPVFVGQDGGTSKYWLAINPANSATRYDVRCIDVKRWPNGLQMGTGYQYKTPGIDAYADSERMPGPVVTGMRFESIGSLHAPEQDGWGAVHAQNTDRLVVQANTFVNIQDVHAKRDQMHAVYLVWSTNVIVTDNTVRTTSGDSIRLRSSSQGWIWDNDVRGYPQGWGSAVSDWYCNAACAAQYGQSLEHPSRIEAYAPPPVAAVPLGKDLTYVPVAPYRLLDTRTRTTGMPVGAGSRTDVIVTGAAGVPADAKAVSLNVTGVAPTANTFLRVWPSGTAMPTTSNVNVSAGADAAAGVMVGIGGEGKVSIFNNAGSAHLVVDVTGYFVDGTTGSKFGLPAAGVRVYDSRTGFTADAGTTTTKGTLASGKPRTIAVAGVGAIPRDATAVLANITSVTPADVGNIAAYPAGTKHPGTSSVNHTPGTDVSNRTVVPLSGGKMTLELTGASAHVVVDVVAWISPTGTHRFTPMVPERAADTRVSGGKLGQGKTRAFELATASVPRDASHVLIGVTATQQTATTYVTAWGTGARPASSDLNTGPGRDQANSAIVRLSSTGTGSIYNNAGSTHVILDVLGFFR